MIEQSAHRMMNTNAPGFIIGSTVGMIKFFLMIDATFWLRIVEAGITALISGGCGMAGSFLVALILRKYKKQDNEKISK